MDGRRLSRFLPLFAALGLAAFIGRHAPKDQTVHYVLGSAAADVEELDVRWASGAAAPSAHPAPARDGTRDAGSRGSGVADPDWTREAVFRYAKGHAPRVVTHALRVPDGEYTVEIEIAPSYGPSPAPAVVVRRRVELGGGATSIDLASALRSASTALEDEAGTPPSARRAAAPEGMTR